MNNTSLIVPDNAANLTNNSFTAGPSSTASRFYNPHKHNRFLSNNYNPKSNAPVFQNNFVLPMALNSHTANRTFYNSRVSGQPA